MAGRTSHWDLSRMVQGDLWSADGYKHTDADRVLLDELSYVGAVSHRHTGATASALEPVDPPQLQVFTTGGHLPAGTRVYYKWTYVNTSGLESVASPEAFIDTPEPIEEPSGAVLSFTPTGGTLEGGNYFYVLSAYVGSSIDETLAINYTYLTVPVTTLTNEITLTLPETPAGATGFNIYRKSPGQGVFYYLDSIVTNTATPPTTYVDDGSVEEDCDRTLPTVNRTNSSSSVEIELPISVPALPFGYHWRIYRTFVNSNWNNSYLHDVVEYTVEATPVITTTYLDIGNATISGTFPEITVLIDSPSKILLTDGAEVQGLLPVDMIDGAVGGGGEFSTITIAADTSSADDKDIADYVCDGVNDQVEIQAAVDELGLGLPGVIQFAPGYYQIGGAVDITNSHTSIKFRAQGVGGVGIVEIERVSGTEPIFDLSTVTSGRTYEWENIALYDFDTVTTTAPLVNLGLHVAYFNKCIHENDNTNASGGANIRYSAAATLYLDDCIMWGEGHNLVGASQRIILKANNTLFNPYGAANSDALNFTSCSGGSIIWLNRCYAEDGNTNGYRIDGDTGSTPMPEVRIEGGYCKDFSGESIYVTDILRLRIDHVYIGNTIENAIRASNVDGGIIANSTVTDADKHGIWLLDCDSIQITGNDIFDSGEGTDDTYSGVILDGNTNDCVIEGNQIRSTAANKSLNGIRVDDSTCDNNSIVGNDLRGSCKTAGNEVFDAGTNTQGHEVLMVGVSSENVDLVAIAPATTFRMPFPMCLTRVRGSLSIAGGATPMDSVFDVNENGVSVLSTKLTLDAGETTSVTAAVPPVISDPALAEESVISIDVDSTGTGSRGAKVTLYGWRI